MKINKEFERTKTAVLLNQVPVVSSPYTIQNRYEVHGITHDERNLGGRQVITGQHTMHRRAISAVKSEIAKERMAPHAHIDCSKGSRNKFG